MGLHVMAYLVQQPADNRVSLNELTTQFNVSPTYLSKILTQLTKAKLVDSVSGANGGYSVLQSRTKLTFFDVIDALQSIDQINKLPGDARNCEIITELQAAQEQMWQNLKNKKLADLTNI